MTSKKTAHPHETDALTLNGVEFTHRDIHTVVDLFYSRVQTDPLLSVPFMSVHDWPDHVKRLTHFWWIRFGGTPYMLSQYNPVEKHFFAGFNSELLAHWLKLFHATLKEKLSEDQYEIWALATLRMGHALAAKNEMYKQEYERATEARSGGESSDTNSRKSYNC